MLSETILQFADFTTLILIKLVTSLFYLIINYITHKIKLPVTLANVLRLTVSVFDFAIILVLLFYFVWELYDMAIAFSILGVFFIYNSNVRHQLVSACTGARGTIGVYHWHI